MLALLILAACGGDPAPSAAPAAPAPVVEAPPTPEPDEELLRRLDALEERVEAVEIELGRVQIMVAELEEGADQAADVRYNPSATTMGARDVQAALDHLAMEIASVKRGRNEMGRPSGELFRIPDDGPVNPPPEGGSAPPPPR